MPSADPYGLQRFVAAQQPVFPRVRAELVEGRKQTHWMWFIFPQIAGLGHSEMATKFAISLREEAAAYLEHPILGPRLRDCTNLVNQIHGRTVEEIFGTPDNLKFHSSMTLFAATAAAADDRDLFGQALKKYFAGVGDRPTLERLDTL